MNCNDEFRQIFKDGEYVVVTNHNYDSTQKKRRNVRNANLLEQKINEKKFPYNKFTETIETRSRLNENETHKENVTFFIVKADDSNDEIFNDCTKNYDVENFIIGRDFMIPHSENEKLEFEKKRIIFPQDVFVFPDELGDWKFDLDRRFYFNKYRTSVAAIVTSNKVAERIFRLRIIFLANRSTIPRRKS